MFIQILPFVLILAAFSGFWIILLYSGRFGYPWFWHPKAVWFRGAWFLGVEVFWVSLTALALSVIATHLDRTLYRTTEPWILGSLVFLASGFLLCYIVLKTIQEDSRKRRKR